MAATVISKQGGERQPHAAWRTGYNVLQELCILGLCEILQVSKVRHKLWLVERLLLGQEIQVLRVGQALHKLGAC